MVTTVPDELRTPNSGDQYALVQDLGGLADTVQNALIRRANMYSGTVAQRTAFITAANGVLWYDTDGTNNIWVRENNAWVSASNLMRGTSAQRTAALTSVKDGQRWQDTNGTRSEYIKTGTAWQQYSSGGIRFGLASERALTTARFGEFWQDTDGSKFVWKGRTDGSWTRASGTGTDGTKAWDTTSGGTLAGRTISVTLPCVLEANETLLVQSTSIGSGFGFISVASIIKNASNTVLNMRFMQIISTTQQALGYVWQIV